MVWFSVGIPRTMEPTSTGEGQVHDEIKTRESGPGPPQFVKGEPWGVGRRLQPHREVGLALLKRGCHRREWVDTEKLPRRPWTPQTTVPVRP